MGNTVHNDQNDDGFKVFPLFDSFENVLCTGFVFLIVSILIDDFVYFLYVFLSPVEFCYLVVNLFCVPLEVLAH